MRYSKRVTDDDLNIEAINIDEVTSSAEENAWYVTLGIKDNKVKFKIDTAAQTHAISKQQARVIQKYCPFNIKQHRKRLTARIWRQQTICCGQMQAAMHLQGKDIHM